MKCPKCNYPRARFLDNRLESVRRKKRTIRQSLRRSREQREGWRSRHSAKVEKTGPRTVFKAECPKCGYKWDAAPEEIKSMEVDKSEV